MNGYNLIEVHGHVQCSICGRIVESCCEGGPTIESPAPEPQHTSYKHASKSQCGTDDQEHELHYKLYIIFARLHVDYPDSKLLQSLLESLSEHKFSSPPPQKDMPRNDAPLTGKDPLDELYHSQ